MRPEFTTYGMRIAKVVAQRATCLRASVGCVFFDEQKRVLATGYNGPPKNFKHCNERCVGQLPQGTDDCPATHAEINGLIQCTKPDDVYYVFCTRLPCFRCTKALLNTSMKELYFAETHAEKLKVLDLLDKGDIKYELL
jgi:dCMP deaminase